MTPYRNTTFDVMDDFFNTFGTPTRTTFGKNNTTTTTSTTTPRANIAQTNTGYTITMAVPGFTREQFDINVTNNVLTVTMTDNTPITETNYLRQEFSFGNFTRTWSLPKNVDTEDVTAAYTSGILTLTIPTTGRTTQYQIAVD